MRFPLPGIPAEVRVPSAPAEVTRFEPFPALLHFDAAQQNKRYAWRLIKQAVQVIDRIPDGERGRGLDELREVLEKFI
jgi:hypothetical protein